MQKDHSFWPKWAHFLHQWGLSEISAALLEAAAPIHLILAQFFYAGQPILRDVVDDRHFKALVNLLEDQEESRSFAAYIREESSG